MTKAEKDRARKSGRMISEFGPGPEHLKCGSCGHLKTYTRDNNYFKCEVYGISQSTATDWRLSYPSCGMYMKPWNGIPVRHNLPDEKIPENDTFPGQMSIEDFGL